MRFDEAIGTTEFRDDPYPYYRELQEAEPLHWCEPWGCWVLSRYADIAPVIQDYKRFSNRARVTNVIRREFPESFLEKIQPLLQHFGQGLINVDPPDHTRLRKLVQKTFLPKTLERLKPHIQAIVDELLDQVVPTGKIEIVRDLAYPLPVTVIAELLGVPTDMRQQFKELSGTILEFQAMPRPEEATILRSQEALIELRSYLDEVARERRQNPRDDLMTQLVSVEEEGDRLSHEELLSTSVGLLVAGHETTTNLITSAVWLFLRHGIDTAKLAEDPSLMETAIEEVLRFESPLQRLGRTVIEDCQLHGTTIRSGETLFSLLGAANRDPSQFDQPNTLNIHRSPNRHLAFGHGVHFCLGAPLARIEAPIALKTLFTRLPEVKLATDQVRWNSGVMRGIKRLPLTFSSADR